MADNVDAKTAANVPVAADEVTYSGDAGQKLQLVRIVYVSGAEGAKTVVDIPGDATYGLDVDVTRLPALPAGTNNIGDVDVLSLPALVAGTAYIGKVRLTDGTNDATLSTAFADATSNTQNAVITGSFSMGFNGTSWDRMRLSSAFADGESNSQIALLTESYNVMYNGTTWDRVRGDTTSGLWVNVKADATNSAASTLNSTSSDGGTALTSTAQAIKGSAGVLKGYYIYNPNATAAYVQFYNTAQGSVTVGTTNPLFMLTIPPASAANLWMPAGVTFSTAMSWAATSTAGGNGAPTTALDAVAWYS